MAISGPVNTPGSTGFSASGTGTSLTIPCTGSTSGNQLFAFVAWGTSSGVTASPSSGWTAVASGSNSQIFQTVYARTATGSDSLTVTFSASVNRAALAAYEMTGSGYAVSAFNAGNQAPGPSATPPIASQCFSIYSFAGTFATPGVAGVSTNPTVGTYDGNVSGGTASSFTISLAFSHLASTSGSASKITWASSPGFETNGQIILAPLVGTTSHAATSVTSAKIAARPSSLATALSSVSSRAGAMASTLRTATASASGRVIALSTAVSHAASTLSGARFFLASARASAAMSTVGRFVASARSLAAATSSALGSRGVTHYLRTAASSTVSAARGVRAITNTAATSVLFAPAKIVTAISSRATSAAIAVRRVVLVVSARAASSASAARSAVALTRTAASSAASARIKATAATVRSATSATSANVRHAIVIFKSASTAAQAAFHAVISGRIASAVSAVSARLRPVVTVAKRATSAATAAPVILAARGRFRATSTVHAVPRIVQAITRSATSTVRAIRGSFFVSLVVQAIAAVRAAWVNTSDTIGQDEVCYAIEDAILQLITQAQQPGGKLATASQYAPVAIVERVVPPEQRIFPNVAVQFRRLDVTPSGLNREDVTATYDISVAVQQPYTAGQPATIGGARAHLAPYVDDGAGNGVIEILRANPTLSGLCRRSRVVALEEATLQTVSATGGAIVAAFIVLQCDYTVTVGP